MTVDNNGPEIISRSSCFSFEIRIPGENRFHLERLRIAMGEKTVEAAASRAIKEFAESLGIKFSDEPIDFASLERFGLEASGNTVLLKRKQGLLVCWLPEALTPDWFEVIKKSTGFAKTSELVRAALNNAHARYVR